MRQSEINIGDWVQSKSDQSIIQIKNHWDIYNAKDFNPVPITTKILKENGFKYNEEKDLLTCWVGNSFIDYDEPFHYFMLLNKRRSYEGELQYVHELQHALRLCGIEKKIEL